jgi:hypothetical protein
MHTTQAGPIHKIETSADGGKTRYSFFEPTESVMRSLMDDLFVNHWAKITVGPCLEGVVFEIRFENAPKLSYSDGYLTVDLGKWHFHLCIGPTKSSKSEEIRQARPVANAALFETQGVGHGRSWGLRFWNGFGEQMTTVFLPSPRLNDDMQFLKEPDWSRLELYYQLRARLLGEPVPENLQAAGTEDWPATS